MASTRRLSRWALAQRLQALALQLAAGRPIRVGGTTVAVPDQVTVEEELEMQGAEIELELEIKWPKLATTKRLAKAARATSRRAGKRARH